MRRAGWLGWASTPSNALIVDAAAALTDRRGLGPATLLLGRRLSDLGYGAGVWVGAVRARSPQALRLRLLRAHRSVR